MGARYVPEASSIRENSHLKPDASRARADLGWAPELGLEAALE
jgi:nucleoside-diphosphate-sugar epimerase